jgi:hypothetical protein
VKGKIDLMKNSLRRRFWVETILAAITGIMFLITLVWHDWIEIVFNVDPDHGSGSLELLIIGILLVVTIVFLVLANFEWRRARTQVAIS